MRLLCHKGQWIATKCLYYRSSLIKSTCTHRRCQFIHTVARVTSPKRLEVSGYYEDLPPHTVRKRLVLYSSFACVGFEGLIQLKHLNLILIQVYLKGHGRRKRRIPEVWPRSLVCSQCLPHMVGGTGEGRAGEQWQTAGHLLESPLNWADAQLEFLLRITRTEEYYRTTRFYRMWTRPLKSFYSLHLYNAIKINFCIRCFPWYYKYIVHIHCNVTSYI